MPVADNVARSDMFRYQISFRIKENFLHGIEPNIDRMGAAGTRL